MRSHRLVTGLDVGTTKVCAVIAEVEPEAEPNVVGVGIAPCSGLRKGIVVDLDAVTTAVHEALEEAENAAGTAVRSVLLGVTGEHIACLNNRSVVAIAQLGRQISSNDVEKALNSARVIVLPPDREVIHAIPRDYSVDGQAGVQSPVGMYGSRLEVEAHIVTGLSSFIRNVVKCVHQAGWVVDATILEPIATGESVLLPAEKDLGVALVDIGGGTSDVAVYIEGRIYHSGVIPVGGSHVTRDIAIGLRTTLEEAERVKIAHGVVSADGELPAFEVTSLGASRPRQLPGKVLAEIIEPRMMEIFHLVCEEIEKSGCTDRIPAGLVITGGGAQLRGLAELSSQTTGMPARIGQPTGVTGLTERISNPACATAVGLVLFWTRSHPEYEGDGRWQSVLAGAEKKIREMVAKLSGFQIT